MKNSKKQTSRISNTAFIDYRPAELRTGTRLLIVYYTKNPITKDMERHRVSVPTAKVKAERLKTGKRMVLDINRKLNEGWLPYYDNADANDFKTFAYCTDKFLEIIEKDVANGTKRNDTLKSYKSGISMLQKYIIDNKVRINLMLDINKPFVMNYLDWMFYERKVSATTYNNHIVFLGLFFSFCLDRGFVKQNFAVGIPKKKKEPKKRVVFTDDVKEKQ
jgi:integrase/recombinase XerD